MCIYRCSLLSAGCKCKWPHVCKSEHLFSPSLKQRTGSLPSLLFFFPVNHTSLPLFAVSSAPLFPQPSLMFGNVITFHGLCRGEKRGEKEFKGTWCRERKRHLYVYPITTPACPKSPSQRAHAYSENSYFHPASSERVTVVMRKTG